MSWTRMGLKKIGRSPSAVCVTLPFVILHARFSESDIVTADFTKHLNRLRQHASQREYGKLHPRQGQLLLWRVCPLSTGPDNTSQMLPLAHRRRRARRRHSLRVSLPASRRYQQMRASVNRKGPSAQANMKDKSDRATNEQVLDPRGH